MLDALKTLFENNVVSSEVRTSIEEAWNTKVRENRQHATSELREEFAKKYEHDKGVMVEAIDSMVTERLATEINEFHEDKKQLAESKARYHVAMKENAGLLKKFVMEQLAKEVDDLHADQTRIAKNFGKLEEFVVESLSTEIADFYEDKKDLAETKVRLISEAKTHFAKVKKTFVQRSATMVAETVDKALKKEISQLKEDITFARRNDFGRKIFEAFASEYGHSYLSEKSETAKLMKLVDVAKSKVLEARAEASKARKLAESANTKNKMLIESSSRKEKLSELISPLSGAQKEIMIDLLESVQTAKLSSAFDKYLPAVINSNSSTKQDAPAKRQAINESQAQKEITGNRKPKVSTDHYAGKDNVIDLRKLAGIN